MKKKYITIIASILFLLAFSVYAQTAEYETQVQGSEKNWDYTYNYIGIIASQKASVYEDFNKEPSFELQKNTRVNIIGASKNDYYYKVSNETYHYFLIETADKKRGWIYGRDMLVVARDSELPPVYCDGSNGYISICSDLLPLDPHEYDGFVFFVTGSPKGARGYYNDNKRYLYLMYSKDPFCFTGSNDYCRYTYEWSETNGGFEENLIDKNDTSQISYLFENKNVLISDETFLSKEYYAFMQAIKNDDFNTMKDLIEDGFIIKQDGILIMQENNPLKYCVDNNKGEALKIMLAAGFTDYFWYPGDDDYNVYPIEKYAADQKKSNLFK